MRHRKKEVRLSHFKIQELKVCAQTTRSGAPSRVPTCVWTVLQAPAQAARQTEAPGLWDSPQRRHYKKIK
jgi:hypothetical protein